MNFTRVNPAGWALNAPITSLQINTLDIDHTKAPNFDDGSAHSPAANIELTGPFGLKLMGAQQILLASRNVDRHQDMLGYTASANWVHRPYNSWRNTAVGGVLFLPLNRLLHSGTLSNVYLRWCGAGGHAAFPAGAPIMPQFELWEIDSDGVAVSKGIATDTSATAGIYEAPHWITLAPACVIDLATKRYSIEVTGELGGNFIANAEALSHYVKVAATSYQEF